MSFPLARNQTIPAETIEAIRTLCPIEEIISEYVRLRRSGQQLLGRCPFHADSTPSFSVNPSKQVFHCHGCGAGGDVFTFIQTSLSCGFRDAVAHLAGRAGVDLAGFKPSPELRELVARKQREDNERQSFERFAISWINLVNRQYRARAKAATEAENRLRAGGLTPEEHELAWRALEEYRRIEARVEREGLCDLEVIRSEWARKDPVANAA
jgi:DNA primase catalytic core